MRLGEGGKAKQGGGEWSSIGSQTVVHLQLVVAGCRRSSVYGGDVSTACIVVTKRMGGWMDGWMNRWLDVPDDIGSMLCGCRLQGGLPSTAPAGGGQHTYPVPGHAPCFVQQHVLRLQVAVHQPLAVHVLQRQDD